MSEHPHPAAPTGAQASSPRSWGRRTFMLYAGASASAALFGALGGCNDDTPGQARAVGALDASAANAASDPIWGPTGLATKIIASLQNITPAMFPNVDFNVTSYGALPLPASLVVAATAWGVPIPWYTTSPNAAGPASPGSNLMVSSDASGGQYDSCKAFNAAIQAAHAAGGGRVVVPSGNWYCGGPIVLLSNVNFYLSANCTIYFSPKPTDYALTGPYPSANGNLFWTRWQANDCLNFGSPVYAYGQTNVGLSGADNTAILNGQAMTPFEPNDGKTTPATCWWTWKGTSGAYGYASGMANQGSSNPANGATLTVPENAASVPGQALALSLLQASSWQQDQNYLPALSQLGVPPTARVFGNGHYLRPCMIELIGCTNVLLQNYHTQNTPFWQHHPVNCTNLVVKGVFADSIGPNNDGFDPDACNNVLIDGMSFNTGDDCIAVKSGKALDTQYGPAQNIVIQNCTMNSGHGGITLGSEIAAGIQNVYARNLNMLNQNWASNPLQIAIRIKTNMNRGGFVENVYINGVTLPNGITGEGKPEGSIIKGSPIQAPSASTPPLGVSTGAAPATAYPAASQGGLITFDCDYSPNGDAIRWTPSTVKNINITNVSASNAAQSVAGPSTGTGTMGAATVSCYQAIVAQGPVASDYNGASPAPAVPPITGVTISNSNLGTPYCTGTGSASAPGATYAWNVNGIALQNVVIDGTTYNTTLTG